MQILVTGAAGFIGYHVCQSLLQRGYEVIGLDNLSPYYDIELKLARLKQLSQCEGSDLTNLNERFSFIKASMADAKLVQQIFKDNQFDAVIHLAAQAGVRESQKHIQSYIDSNIQGFINLLEACRQYPPDHLLFASSSSVYGESVKQPFAVEDSTDRPISLYAASKKSNEVMAYSYAHLFGVPCTGLRFFTVYGPWGRPDMAYFKFTSQILNNEPINVFNNGNLMRDFTYIDDIVEAIIKLLDIVPTNTVRSGKILQDAAPYRLLNIGNNQPIKLMDFIHTLEELLGVEARKNFLPLQPGDVLSTYADVSDLEQLIQFTPKTDIKTGLSHFIRWYKAFYGYEK